MPKDKLQDEFMELLNQCQGTIIKLCLLHTDRQPDSVNDLYQEIVCNLWESFPRFRHLGLPHSSQHRLYATSLTQAHSKVHLSQRLYVRKYCQPEENNMINRLYQLINLLDEYEVAI